MAQTIADKTLTSANSVLLWRAKGYSDTYTQVQGYKPDASFEFGDEALGETVIGVDGQLSGAHIHSSVTLTIHLAANSPTRAHFARMRDAIKSQMETFKFDFAVEYPSIKVRKTCSGFMTQLGGLSNGRMLDTGVYTFEVSGMTEEEII